MPASSLFLIMIRCRRWFFVLRFGKITSMVPMTLVLFSQVVGFTCLTGWPIVALVGIICTTLLLVCRSGRVGNGLLRLFMKVLMPIGCRGRCPSSMIRFLWLKIVIWAALIMVVVAEVSIIIPFVKFLSLIFVIAGCFSSSLSMTLLWVVRLEVGLGCKVMSTSFILLMILRLRLKPTTA